MTTVTTTSRPAGHPGYSQSLPREPRSAATARRLVLAACAAWGLDELAEDGALIVSELVSNTVRHARCHSIRVTVIRPSASRVRIGVVDLSKVPPQLWAPSAEDENGRGLALVGALADDWGIDPLPWGKRVWAELRAKGHG